MIDNLDKKIIELLKKDSRCPFVEIANQLGVSEGTVRSRVHKMVEEGIIRGFTIKTSSKNVKALVEISIAVNTDTQEIARELAGYDGVTEVFEVTGDQDIIAIVDVESSQHLNEIIERVRRYDNILSTRTRLILKEHYGEARSRCSQEPEPHSSRRSPRTAPSTRRRSGVSSTSRNPTGWTSSCRAGAPASPPPSTTRSTSA